MAWDLESMGGGAGAGLIGGIFGAILHAFGINRRINKLEDEKLGKDVFIEFRKNIDDKFTTVIEGQNKVWERLGSLSDFVRNQK